MEVTSVSVFVADLSHVAQARRAAMACARAIGFGESDIGRVALVATEAATNVLKHAGRGTILVGAAPSGHGDAHAVDLVAIDKGPGMANVDDCLIDGYSTAGSPGTGLGALRRVSSLFDCYSRPGVGTVLLARVAPERRARSTPRLRVGAVSVPYPGETECGDQWALASDRLATSVVVSDGLGHGGAAAEAARAATAVLARRPDASPVQLVTLIHDALRHTRGAAVAAARLEPEAARVTYCGVGNICATIISAPKARHMVSHNGTAGRAAPRIQELAYELPPDALLVLHSDGIAMRWRLDDYPGLVGRHPAIIAAVLYRDFSRGRDDATAIVVQAPRAA